MTWPINNKPPKDEEFMTQAKVQVDAKSEKEAMQQQQLELQVVESFEDNASATQNNESKSPMV